MARRLIDQNRARELRRQNRLLDRLENGFRNRVDSELRRAMSEMVEAYEATGEVMPARDHRDAIEAAFLGMAGEAATTFGARVAEQGKSQGQVLETKDFADTMARLALGYVAGEAIRRRITNIADTTRAQIVAAVQRGYDAGEGVSVIARGVRDKIGDISKSRSALIARTETHGAANFGANEAAKETGLNLRQEWIAAEDSRTRADHAAADGQVVGMDEPFIVGGGSLMYPGDPAGSAAQTVNCRCAVAHIVVDD